MSRGKTILLVSCVGQKLPHPAPAKDLYDSPWFRKARAHAERTGQPWFVLSAEHGLVHPCDVIAPSNVTLNDMPVAGRRKWASRVLEQLEPHLDGVESIVFLAGQRYRECLERLLRSRGLAISVPMGGLKIGEQLSWLSGCEAERLADTIRFYALLDCLAARVGRPRRQSECRAGMDWPERGVYFFFEDGEARSGSGAGLRVLRVGTHALKDGSGSTLWGRLSQHRGNRSGGGNHRGSIFRKLVGVALAKRNNIPLPDSWGVGNSVGEAAQRLNVEKGTVRKDEACIEACVSKYIGQMPFLWLKVDDPPGRHSRRGFIERNAIALLSGYRRPALDKPSKEWLGHYSDRERVRLSGLWNNNHVGETYDPPFLDEMESWIDATPQ